MDSKCPNCGITDWLSVDHGERCSAKCLQCGQVKIGKSVRRIQAARVSAFLLELFPAADRHQNP